MNSQARKQYFDNIVPKEDFLDLKKGIIEKVPEFLELSKTDVAKATGIPKSSIHYRNQVPEELKQRLLEIGLVCELVARYFQGDLEKTFLWFKIQNPGLGNISPRDMIRIGQYQKVIKFIRNSLNGNIP